MLCEVCGTRNVADEKHCSRCGARLAAPQPEPIAEPEPEPLSPGEALAMEAGGLLGAGDRRGALQAAQRAAVMEPDSYLCRVALGDAYLATEAPSDALREFRRAAELDPDRPEAKEKAETARRRLTRADELSAASPTDWRGWLVARKRWVSIAAGALVALLVFAVGASAIVSRTSPAAQLQRSYREQMRLGSEHYKAGRYVEAAQAFEEASRLRPDSQEARRRTDDARAVAGLPTSSGIAPVYPGGRQVAQILPGEGPNPFPEVWVGPRPHGPQAGAPADDGSRALPPPPPLPPQGPIVDTNNPPLPPPTSPTVVTPGNDVVDTLTGPPRTSDTGTWEPPTPSGETPEDSAEQPTERRKPGHIVIRRDEAPPAPPPQATDIEPKSSNAAALRAEAERLWAAGRHAEAARKFGAAATGFRDEAKQGGAGAATKRSAAASCEAAQKACESQAD